MIVIRSSIRHKRLSEWDSLLDILERNYHRANSYCSNIGLLIYHNET